MVEDPEDLLWMHNVYKNSLLDLRLLHPLEPPEVSSHNFRDGIRLPESLKSITELNLLSET